MDELNKAFDELAAAVLAVAVPVLVSIWWWATAVAWRGASIAGRAHPRAGFAGDRVAGWLEVRAWRADRRVTR